MVEPTASVQVQPIPPIKVPASWTAEFKKIAGIVSATAASIGAVLATIVNVAPSVHVPAPEIAILVAVSSVVAAIATEAGSLAKAKKAAKSAAK